MMKQGKATRARPPGPDGDAGGAGARQRRLICDRLAELEADEVLDYAQRLVWFLPAETLDGLFLPLAALERHADSGTRVDLLQR